MGGTCFPPFAPETAMTRKIEKTDAEWRAQLSPDEYHVTRQKGTERAFTGRYWDCHEPGQYRCTCCGADLFSSEHKFDSGCGWPSFYAAAAPDNVEEAEDRSHFMLRTEVLCKNCGAHLGHVFEDGPAPPGCATASTRWR
jgi:peptide-methionine (R)-S-oxide reductase